MTSRRTTDLGPRLSASTTDFGATGDETRAKVNFVDANAAVVRGVDSGITASAAQLELDGQIMIDRDASVATLTVRSGNTFWEFESDNASTI